MNICPKVSWDIGARNGRPAPENTVKRPFLDLHCDSQVGRTTSESFNSAADLQQWPVPYRKLKSDRLQTNKNQPSWTEIELETNGYQ